MTVPKLSASITMGRREYKLLVACDIGSITREESLLNIQQRSSKTYRSICFEEFLSIFHSTSKPNWKLCSLDDMEDYVAKLLVFSVMAWAALFLAIMRTMFPKRSFDFCNRLVSTLHALLAVVLASLSLQDWSCPVCPLASQSSPKQMQVLAVTGGYLIYDLVCCQFDKQVKVDNIVHHLVSITGLIAGLVYQRCGSEMVAALCITEISSPFLHLRELLKELGYKGTDLNLAADIAFAVIFTFARMIGGPYLTYVTLSAHNPPLIKAMALGLQLVSGFWFYKIVRMIIYKFSIRSPSLKTQ